MKRTTIKDIARKLGVNPSTVSRALKDHPDIGPALRAEIKKLAETLHYRPNQMAVHLRQRSSHLIGLIVPELAMFFYPSVIKGMEEVLHRRNYTLIMLPSNESSERELENLQICAENEVAGILIAVSRHTRLAEKLAELQELGIPVVVFDKTRENLPFDSVVLEDADSAENAAERLIAGGCKRLGGIFGNPHLLITQKRVQGFKKALEKHGLPFFEPYALFADNAEEAGHCASILMQLDPAPDGIFLMSDEIIIGAMPAIARSGKKIPEDCSVICISEGFLPYHIHPRLTFLHHNAFEQGRLAASQLVSLIESGAYMEDGYCGEKTMIQASLVELDTTRPITT